MKLWNTSVKPHKNNTPLKPKSMPNRKSMPGNGFTHKLVRVNKPSAPPVKGN